MFGPQDVEKAGRQRRRRRIDLPRGGGGQDFGFVCPRGGGFLQQLQRGFGHARGADAGHAAVVDGAFAQQAGAAIGGFAHHAGQRAGGAGGGIVGRAENRDGGHAQRGGDVHRAGIVGQEQAAGGGQVDEFAERGFAGQVANRDARCAQRRRHGLAQRALGRRSENQDGGLQRAGDCRAPTSAKRSGSQRLALP